MTDPITITRDDGSPLTLSRAEVVRAMAAMRVEDARKAWCGCNGETCYACRRARAVRRG